MFSRADQFDQDLSRWHVSQAVSMQGMFLDASSFRGFGLENWDVSHVEKTLVRCSREQNSSTAISHCGTLPVRQRCSMHSAKQNRSIFLCQTGIYLELLAWTVSSDQPNYLMQTFRVGTSPALDFFSHCFDGAGSFNQPLMTWKT